MTMEDPGSSSILIHAASSGNPDVVREILQYHPKLEAKNREGRTALFLAASEYNSETPHGARAECVRILAESGANISPRDTDGNTPLHETLDEDVARELIKLGADPNGRNNDGETPLSTTYSDEIVFVLIEHGADPNLPDKDGRSALEASKNNAPKHEAILEAMRKRAGQ
jgi:ankyrin repeat protein